VLNQPSPVFTNRRRKLASDWVATRDGNASLRYKFSGLQAIRLSHSRISLARKRGQESRVIATSLLALLYAVGDASRFEQRHRETTLSRGTAVRPCKQRAHCRISARILQLRLKQSFNPLT
jgi:hypothetical protein